MKLLFISGPYRAKTIYGTLQNIRRAERWALYFWRRGFAVICPHKNTALFDGAADESIWLEGDKEMLRRCDAVFAMTGWENSEGAKAEIKEARRLGLDILYQ